ncbi:hypothetical protein M595_4893 [Lyngbya aestuarii BL J]|mgnify:CR=1 FL=1|jgi:hypothetical protein|uniref:Uncharacterized protein n=1 Tax=Lyngbya aestuarii BL J TaxID=1348334 RepID=U7QBC0_9CYAN|nr:hypothetical protein [Lyngbya aestuarii]ERT05154.1 hypothetical protein M595_4893 [Lyngbya aestuarii BL J]
MINFISGIYTHISTWLNKFQVKRFLAAILVGSLLLTTGLSEGTNRSLTNKVDNTIHQGDSQRPKTTGEWKAEARETENAPGERIQRIAGESAEAVKDWASLYPEVADSTFEDDSVQTK